ncbi:MAG: dienelactone hydrolase family protein [Myxococcaceae bacterium]|nr:dienelactone hydrolase family protein [Myxococcaceae bacterium]
MSEDAPSRPAVDSTRVLRLAPRAPGRRLFVYLHGYGARAENLHGVAEDLAAAFPDSESLLPDGFEPTATGAGRHWWSVADMTDENRARRIAAATDAFEPWLDRELEARSLGSSDVTLVGFSQGAALAVSLGTRRELDGVVSFCGRPTDPRGTSVRTRMLLVQGTQDPFISAADATRFEAALRSQGAHVELRLLEGLGHGINREAVDLARRFMAASPRASP